MAIKFGRAQPSFKECTVFYVLKLLQYVEICKPHWKSLSITSKIFNWVLFIFMPKSRPEHSTACGPHPTHYGLRATFRPLAISVWTCSGAPLDSALHNSPSFLCGPLRKLIATWGAFIYCLRGSMCSEYIPWHLSLPCLTFNATSWHVEKPNISI